jgi:hypothetical protein
MCDSDGVDGEATAIVGGVGNVDESSRWALTAALRHEVEAYERECRIGLLRRLADQYVESDQWDAEAESDEWPAGPVDLGDLAEQLADTTDALVEALRERVKASPTPANEFAWELASHALTDLRAATPLICAAIRVVDVVDGGPQERGRDWPELG